MSAEYDPSYGKLLRRFDEASAAQMYAWMGAFLALTFAVSLYASNITTEGWREGWVKISASSGVMLGVVLILAIRRASRDKCVAIFERGILIGDSFLPWRDTKDIECSQIKRKNFYRTDWTFHKSDGTKIRHKTMDFYSGNVSINVDQFNQALRDTGIPFVKK